MTKFFKNLTLLLLPVVTLVLGWQIGLQSERMRLDDQWQQIEIMMAGNVSSGSTVQNPREEVDISLLWSVWGLLSEHYIEPDSLQVTPMLHGAVAGLVNALDDPYTSFMPPRENKEFKQALNGNLQGIGAELTDRDGSIVVVSPLKGSPAETAGLLSEDIIIKVDNQDIVDFTLTEAVQLIRGPKGTEVTLTVLRGDNEVEITIVRDDIKVPSTEFEIKEYNGKRIGYIAINRFAERTGDEVEEEVQSFVDEGVDGIILDVRFNGGGYLDKATDMASLFLRSGKVVSVVRRNGDPTHHYVTGRPIAEEVPLVILINEGSASASEILAGALQDAGRATIVGKKSFGKGTVQEVFDLPGGTSIRITTAKWLTPAGRDLGKEGIMPDIEVERTQEDMQNGNDPQLDRALEVVSGNTAE